MTLTHEDNIKTLDHKPYTLSLKHHTWHKCHAQLRKKLTDLEKKATFCPSPQTSQEKGPVHT